MRQTSDISSGMRRGHDMWNLMMSAAVFVVLLVAGLSALFVLGPPRSVVLTGTRSTAPTAGAATES